MDDSLSGTQAYLIIFENNDQCPVRNPTVLPDGTPFSMNGFIAFTSTNPWPFNSFSAIAHNCLGTSWVLNVDTGELRYYQIDIAHPDPDEYWTPMQLAMGKTQSISITESHQSMAIKELGQQYAHGIPHQTDDIRFQLSKTFISKDKLDISTDIDIDVDSPLGNIIGYDGHEFINDSSFLSYVQVLRKNWFFVVLYYLYHDNDDGKIAKTIILPCARFDNIEIINESSRIIRCNLSGKATYMIQYPAKEIITYGQSIVVPEIECTVVEIEWWNQTPADAWVGHHAGHGGVFYTWKGQTFTTIGAFELCSVGIQLGNYVLTSDHKPLIIRLWDAVSGNLLASSLPKAWDELIANSENKFLFPASINLLATTQYFFTIEDTEEPTNPYTFHIIIEEDEPGGYAGGNAYYSIDLIYPPGSSWQVENEDLWFKIYKVT